MESIKKKKEDAKGICTKNYESQELKDFMIWFASKWDIFPLFLSLHFFEKHRQVYEIKVNLLPKTREENAIICF